MHGGKRPGAGRKKGTRLDHAAIDLAATVLADNKPEKIWKSLLASQDERVKCDALKYLTNRAFGMPRQQIEADVTGNVLLQVVTGVPVEPED